MERLQKVIAAAGIASRRKAEQLISEGKVKVNGTVMSELGYIVKKNDTIEVNGKGIVKEDKVYFVMNKPKKCMCTNDDEFDRNTVISLINCKERIFSVGRLDYDTSGVLILTNDGEFANLIIHPRTHLPKKYSLTIKGKKKSDCGVINSEQVRELARGIKLEDGMTLPAKVKVIKKDMVKNQTDLELIIYEGKNHQVKRMMEYFNFEVTRLHRKELGFLKVEDMSQGDYRRLKPYEIKKLRMMAEEGKL
ncbi:MAG: pseudouridine synthase [Erysipelotrichaceae bacterium]